MCKFCELANRLEKEESNPRWYHFLNRIILIVTILAVATWLLGSWNNG